MYSYNCGPGGQPVNTVIIIKGFKCLPDKQQYKNRDDKIYSFVTKMPENVCILS